MAEPFKNQLSAERIAIIAEYFSKYHEGFNASQFLTQATDNLAELSLMQRNRQIVQALKQYLPTDIEQSFRIIEKTLAPTHMQNDEQGLHSWLVVPLAEYVGQTGCAHIPQAMALLSKITPLFSSEWGIRHLLIQQPQQTLKILHTWCQHENEHVRRLVSEGTRPRLPWGMQLPAFMQDPTITFALLEQLKDDDSDYVRLSVANHLNDMSKDHPDWLAQQLQTWYLPNNKNRSKLIRHACRTLIKKGHTPTLTMLGFDAFQARDVVLTIHQPVVKFGEQLVFDLNFTSVQSKAIVVDYAIHFKKANGSNAPKVFKWKVGNVSPEKPFALTKRHVIKAITTRRYYNGEHHLEIFINGQSVAMQSFELTHVPAV